MSNPEEKKLFAPKLSRLDPKAAANKGTAVKLKNDGEETGEVITVRGRLSEAAEQMQQRAVREMQKQYKRHGKLEPKDPTDQSEERIAYAVACTIGWEGIEDEAGKLLEYSPAAAAKLYGENRLILEQVDAAIGNDALFTKG